MSASPQSRPETTVVPTDSVLIFTSCDLPPAIPEHALVSPILRAADIRRPEKKTTEEADTKPIYVFLDLETTGLGKSCQITQIGAIHAPPDLVGRDASGVVDLEPDCVGVVQPTFDCLVKPSIPIGERAAEITGITDETVQDAEPFKIVGAQFFQWLDRLVRAGHTGDSEEADDDSDRDRQLRRVALVAYNGLGFDFPTLVREAQRSGVDVSAFDDVRLVDPLRWVRRSLPNLGTKRSVRGRPSYKLGDVHHYLLQEPIESAHTALADAYALKAVCLHPTFLGCLHLSEEVPTWGQLRARISGGDRARKRPLKVSSTRPSGLKRRKIGHHGKFKGISIKSSS